MELSALQNLQSSLEQAWHNHFLCQGMDLIRQFRLACNGIEYFSSDKVIVMLRARMSGPWWQRKIAQYNADRILIGYQYLSSETA